MLLALFALTAGYALGFRDAKTHDRTVIERVLDRAGGSARGKYNPDIDDAMDRAGEPGR